jgi:UDP-N-acetylenolpyruvoylglucosamine reductase
MRLVQADGYSKDNSPSIDKIVPEKGYIDGNVQVISLKANVMKNNATPDDLRRFAAWIRETYGE